MTPKIVGRTLSPFSLNWARQTSTAMAIVMVFSLAAAGQSPAPTPSATDGRYSVTASVEVGARLVDVSGDEEKFKSDLNYRKGFRVFDSSIAIEDNGKDNKFFDSALFISSGWGADPNGFVRTNLERNGIYRFDMNVRRLAFYNNLDNHAIGGSLINYHNRDTRRNFGDMDLTILPDNRTIRFRLGYSYNLLSGEGMTTSRVSDVFPVNYDARQRAHDFRAGADGSILGFNVSGTYGYRSFRDRNTYFLERPDPGDVTTNSVAVLSMNRQNPLDGDTHHVNFSAQRTFADRFDVTARVLHSTTLMDFSWAESVLYRDATNRLTRDDYNYTGDAKRPQTRADLGMTWRITDKFRLSNTFTYDAFNINGGNLYALDRFVTSTTLTRNSNYTVTRYRRYTNLFEGDYQFSPRAGVNVGYRFTHRDARLEWFGLNTLNNTNLTGSPSIEDANNSTHTFLAGTKVSPLKNWSVFADVEIGRADNVFTRLANYEFANYRVRSRMRFDKWAANVSFISRDNDHPGRNLTNPTESFLTETKQRTFSAVVDWTPMDELDLSGGYDYRHLTSEAFIRLPINSVLVDGLSQYFIRESYFFIDVNARPAKWLTLFGSYRWTKDRGHGDRAIPAIASPIIVGSYPIDFKMPEFRAAIRLNRHLDWNIGYQYFGYDEEPPQNVQWGIPNQNYKAHLPYTSLRIYFGRPSMDR